MHQLPGYSDINQNLASAFIPKVGEMFEDGNVFEQEIEKWAATNYIPIIKSKTSITAYNNCNYKGFKL